MTCRIIANKQDQVRAFDCTSDSSCRRPTTIDTTEFTIKALTDTAF